MSGGHFHAVTPSVGVDVVFWGIDLNREDVQKDEGDKVKDCIMHPGTRPWILCVDRNDNIIIWDYLKKACVCKRTLLEICALPDLSNRNTTAATSSLREHSPFLTSQSYIRDTNAGCGHLPSYLSSLTSNAYSQQQCGDYFRKLVYPTYREKNNPFAPPAQIQPVGSSSTNKAAAAMASARLNPGVVRSLHFVDPESSTFSFGDNLAAGTSGFQTSSRIMVVAENCIIFYDIVAHKSKLIVFPDVKLLCSDFVFFDLLAIGCSDGSVKIWDCSQWKEVKSLNFHSREVVMLKSIQILSKVVDDAGTLHGYRRQASNVSTVGGTVMREGNIRMVSIDATGTVLVWDGAAMGNIVQIDSPSARLQESVGLVTERSVAVDDSANTITIYCADKSIRVFSMDTFDIIRNSKRSSISRQRSSQQLTVASKRTSVAVGFNRPSAADELLADVPYLPCESKIKPSASLPPSVNKIVSYAHSVHPHLRSDAYFSASKSHEIALLQVLSGNTLTSIGDDVSDTASTTDIDDKAHNRLCLVQTIDINVILAYFLKGLKSSVALPIMAHACDPTLKVYSVSTHPTRSTLLLVATSLGVLLLDYCPVHATGPFTAHHTTWSNCVVKFHPSSATLSMVRVDVSVSNAAEGDQHEHVQANLSLHDMQLKALNNTNTSNPHPDPTNNYTSTHSILSSAYRPRVLVSPSGRYCAFIWAELCQYRVVEVLAGPGFVGRENIKEVECGQSLSFAWVGYRDHFAVLSPIRRGEASVAKRRRSIFGGKEEDANPSSVVVIPPAVTLKRIIVDDSTHKHEIEHVEFEAPNESGLNEPQGLLGGPLLLVLYPQKAHSSKKGAGQKSVSKIEAEALEAQIEAAAANADGAGGSDGISSLSSARIAAIKHARQAAAKFGEERIGGNSSSLLTTQCCQFHALNSKGSSTVTAGVEQSINLEPVGPVMHAVAAVSWSPDGKLCALLSNDQVNILRFNKLSNGSYECSTVGSVQVDNILNPIASLAWVSGMLVVTSTSAIHAVLVSEQSQNLLVVCIASSSKAQICPSYCVMNDDVTADHLPHGALSIRSSLLFPRMTQSWGEVVGIRKGNLLIMSRDGDRILLLSLIRNPEVAVACNIQQAVAEHETRKLNEEDTIPSKHINAALNWASLLPSHMHDRLANMFISKGMAVEASLVPNCSVPLALTACHSAGNKDEEEYFLRVVSEVLGRYGIYSTGSLPIPSLNGSVSNSVLSAEVVECTGIFSK